MKKIITLMLLICMAFMFTGCATIYEGPKEEVSFTSEPSGANVFVNDEFRGTTPLTLNLKTSKEYQVTFKKDGYIDYVGRIENSIRLGYVIIDVFMALVPVLIDITTGSLWGFENLGLHAKLVKS